MKLSSLRRNIISLFVCFCSLFCVVQKANSIVSSISIALSEDSLLVSTDSLQVSDTLDNVSLDTISTPVIPPISSSNLSNRPPKPGGDSPFASRPPLHNDSTALLSDSTMLSSDSLGLKQDSVPPKKDALDAKVEYEARDSIIFYSDGTGYLYGEGKINYHVAKPIELTAEYIRFKLDSSTIYAIGTVDTLGDPVGDPIFKEGDQVYESKYMSYNFKTKRAYVKGGVTKQDEGYIIADQTKMFEDQNLCMLGGKYTTCDNHDHPHFYLQLTKAKMKPGSYIAAGPAYMVVADVPLPLALPFGFFPFSNKYSSGVIMPSFGDELSRGFFFKDGGYYWAINDYVDLQVLGEVYTKGTWGVSVTSKYALRYKFSGSFYATYREDVTGEKDMPDYSKTTNFKVQWTHKQDAKASQYSSFSASVDFSTSGYNTSNVNYYYDYTEQSKNITSSSINYTQRFPDSQWSLSMNASLQQRTSDSTLSVTLPSLTASMSQIYPFKRKNSVGSERWYEKIRMSYNMIFSNSITTKESEFLTSSLVKDWSNAVKHSLPISASFTMFKYLNLSLSQSYTERWYFNKVEKDWDTTTQQELSDTTYGFYRVYDFSSSASLSTKLYGYYTPIRKLFGDKIDRIRHVVTPSLSYTYKPDFSNDWFGFYDTYTKTVIDKTNYNQLSTEEVQYSPFSGGMYGVPSSGVSSSLSFSLQNNVEMKVKDRSDSTGLAYKTLSLIDNLGLSWGYNFAADSLNWSNLSTSIRLKLTKKFTLNLSGSFDPYCYLENESGSIVRTNQLRWDVGKFMHFKGTSTSLSYTFNNDTFKKKDKSGSQSSDGIEAPPGGGQIGDLGSSDMSGENGEGEKKGDDKDKKDDKKKDFDPDGYSYLNIPWSFTVNYSVRYTEQTTSEYYSAENMAYKLKFSHSLTFSGNIQPSTNWKMSYSGSMDLTELEITQMSMSISRDLHCWNLTASVTPFGVYKSFLVTIGVKASMLSDLKYDKRSDSSTNVNWLER